MKGALSGLMVAILAAGVVLVGCGGKAGPKPPGTPATTPGGQAAAPSNLPAGIVATYGDKKITQQQFELRMHVFEFIYNQALMADPKAKTGVLDDMITRDLLFQEATAKGFKVDAKSLDDQMTQVYDELNKRYYQNKDGSDKKMKELGISDQDIRNLFGPFLTIHQLLDDLGAKNKPTDADIKAYFDKNPDEFGEQVRASHILVADEAKANDLEAKLKAGGDFAQLAKDNSTDTASATNGGDLGYFGKGKMVAVFEQAAFAAKVGDITAPVKSQYGYHIIKVTDHKPAKTFDDAKATIAQTLQDQAGQTAAQTLLKDLRSKANVQTVTFS